MQGTGINKKPSTLMKHLILISFVILNLNILAREIEETTFSYWDKPDSQIYYSTPKNHRCRYKNYIYYAWRLKGSEKIFK